jgi:hypothetical protein
MYVAGPQPVSTMHPPSETVVSRRGHQHVQFLFPFSKELCNAWETANKGRAAGTQPSSLPVKHPPVMQQSLKWPETDEIGKERPDV